MGYVQVLSFITGNWKILLGAGLIIAALWYVQGLRIEIAQQATQIETLTHDKKTLEDNNAKLTDAINVSNIALEKSQKAADKAKKDFLSLSNDLEKQTAELAKQLEDLLNKVEPATCNDSIIFLISNIKGYAK